MSGYALTPRAKFDVFNIWAYIAEDSVDAAGRVEQAIYDACAFLAQSPLRGHTRQDLTNRPLRFWTLVRYPNFMIVYRPRGSLSRSLPFFTARGISGGFCGPFRNPV